MSSATTNMRLTAQEYTDIMNLYSKMIFATDHGDADEYSALFADEGEIILGDEHHKQGREAIREWRVRGVGAREGWNRRHWYGMINLKRIDQSSVASECYIMARNSRPGERPEIIDAGIFRDVIVLERGEWKFRRRQLSFDYHNSHLPD
jgi:hypothetical protein